MDFLRGLTSTVLAASTGVSFPFTIGDKIPGVEGKSIWELREGVKKDDQTPLTLFIFDSTLPPLGNRDRKNLLLLAKNSLRKLRTIRHPNVIKYIDSVETDTHVYIATERVKPIEQVLREWDTGAYTKSVAGKGKGKDKGKEDWMAWGVMSIGTAISFLNSPPLSVHHGLLLPSSIYVTASLEWKLGGFDVLSTKEDPAGVLWANVGGFGGFAGGDLVPGDVGERSGPEVRRGGWGSLREADPAQSDVYQLALLIFSLYNPGMPLPNLSTSPQPSSIGHVPRSLFPVYKRMLNPNSKTRLPTTNFIPEVTSTGYWTDNTLLCLVAGLDGFELASEGEKLSVLRAVKDASSSLPTPFLTYRILPSLLHSLSLPTAPSSAILPLVLVLGHAVPGNKYAQLILDPVVKLWASPDRGTRMALLDGLSGEAGYGEKLDKATVSEKIWPHLITGFADTVAVIREATIKVIPLLAPKLTDRILNNDLLRLLAKMQVDPEPSIRTNTCILLGRLAPLLGPNTKKKVLIPAFARSLKDSFVHARVAGLMAFMATVEFFDRDDLAGRVIPNMSFTMMDKEKLVRDQAFKAMALFMGKLEQAAAQMPETILQEGQGNPAAIGATTTTSAQPGGQSSLVNSAAGAAGALAGWAIASIGKQLPVSEQHSSISPTGAAASALTPSSAYIPGAYLAATPSADPSPRSSFGDTNKTPARPASRPTAGGTSSRLGGGGGMKLGGKSNGHALADTLGEFQDDDEVANAWGSDDLMDVNADADDWSAFEAAPTPMEVPASKSASNGHRNGSTPSKPKPSAATSSFKLASKANALPDGWDDDPAPTFPSLSISKPAAKKPVATPKAAPAPAPAPVPVMENDGWGEETSASPSPAVSLAGMSKEEKDKEMARRREERKARIAAMKEGKKK